MPDEEESTESNEIGSVSDRVLNAFIAKLASDAEYSEVSDRLKNAVFSEKVSEKSLRTALFDEEES